MPTADVVGTSSENKYGTEYLYYLKHDCDSQYTHTFSNIKITCIYLNYLSLCKILPLSVIFNYFLTAMDSEDFINFSTYIFF